MKTNKIQDRNKSIVEGRSVHKHSQVFVLGRRVKISLTFCFVRVKYECNLNIRVIGV